MINNTLRFFLFITASLGIIACSNTDQTAMNNAAISKKIICHAGYRKTVQLPIEKQAAITFSSSDDEQSISSGPFVFHAQYWSGEMDEERALRVWVTTKDQTNTLTSHLYQLDTLKGPFDQFRGPHGFTGLNYIYDQESGSELQFWCEAIT